MVTRHISPHPLDKREPLLTQCDPDPEPRYHLDKHKGKEDAVLECVTTPAGGHVRRVMRRRVGETAARRGGLVDGGGGSEDESVEEETHGEEGADWG